MTHEIGRYGISFSLPAEWARMKLSGYHFECRGQHIQMKFGPALPQFLDPAARQQHLWETGARVLPRAYLGGETNCIAIAHDATFSAAISAVREEIHYFFEFDGFGRAETDSAFDEIVRTFRFPSQAQALHIQEDLRVPDDPRSRVIAQVMAAGSPEDAHTILQRASATQVGAGYRLDTIGAPSTEAASGQGREFTCPQCNGPVGVSDQRCPRCGLRSPAANSALTGCVIAALIVFGGCYVLFHYVLPYFTK